MRTNYSFIKIFLCLYIERIHRKVFDNFYKQDYVLTFKDKIILCFYKVLCFVYPDFRSYLKFWKPILVRGYNQKRLTIKNQILFLKIRKINVERYSSY